MKTSLQCMKLFEIYWEGCKTQPYKDTKGLWTIGIGHLITDKELRAKTFERGLSMAQVHDLFFKDIARFEKAINELVKVELSQNQFDALVGLIYNIGVKGFTNSTVLRKLNDGKFDEVPAAFKLWNKEFKGGKYVVNEGLVNRREKELRVWHNNYTVPK